MAIGVRPSGPNERLAASPEAFKDAVGSVCPHLIEYMTADKWDDGKPRVTASISVFFEDGVFKVWINDRDLARGACVAGTTLLQALATADRKLEAGDLDWRARNGRSRR